MATSSSTSQPKYKHLSDRLLEPSSPIFLDLKGKHFLADTALAPVINLLATKYRTRKSFLTTFTALHMVVVTLRCNHRCHYCHASSQSYDETRWDMTSDTASGVVRMIMETPSPDVKIEFQGGEPLLNFDVVKQVTKLAKQLNRSKKKNLSFVICSNLTAMNREILSFLRQEGIMVSTSLDGPKDLHDLHRVSRDGSSSYESFVSNLDTCREVLGTDSVSALLTITKDNLPHLRVVIDEYVRRGFDSIFMRSLNPYGYARSEGTYGKLGYTVSDFLGAYKEALAYILNLNLRGIRFVEYYATLLLTRMLTPFATGFVDLQSPSGAGIAGVVYNFNGDVYPTDEARMLAKMGDPHFRMGNVGINSYQDIFLSPIMRELVAKSCLEAMPVCHTCVWRAFCGADPVRNYTLQGDIVGHRPTSEFCEKNKGLMTFLLDLVERADSATVDVLWSWITNRSLSEVRGLAK